MTITKSDSGLEFVKIWHRVFSGNLVYIVEGVMPDQNISQAKLINPSICQTGRWLAKQDIAVTQLDAFKKLVESHNLYHHAAGKLYELFLAGEKIALENFKCTVYEPASESVGACVDRLEEALVELGLSAPRFKSEELAKSDRFWNESFEVGIEDVDRRHYAIASLIEELASTERTEVPTENVRTFVQLLSHLIEDDIQSEDPLLEKMRHEDDPYFDAHLQAHADIKQRLTDLVQEIEGGKSIAYKEIGKELADWFVNHLVEFDLELAKHTKARKAR